MANRGVYLGFVCVVLALLACKAGEGGKCHFNKDCKDNSVCLFNDTGRLAVGEENKCRTLQSAQAKCKERCLDDGLCELGHDLAGDGQGYCHATSDDDCLKSKVCQTLGACRAVDNHCSK